ncbi:MAG: dephospho-CoA kinase [Acidobacteriaceae bacterium]
MLRVGLTGGLGSGKTTVARIFAQHGVHVLEADTIGRELMQPGQPVYRELVAHFRQYGDAPELVLADGSIDRVALAKYVFSTQRLGELNRIVHPAVIAEQERRMQEIFKREPNAIAMVESALIFEADQSGTVPGWRNRFDKLILVTAPEEIRLARYIARATAGKPVLAEQRQALEEDGRRRIVMQIKDEDKIPFCDFVIENSGAIENVEKIVRNVLMELLNHAVPNK